MLAMNKVGMGSSGATDYFMTSGRETDGKYDPLLLMLIFVNMKIICRDHTTPMFLRLFLSITLMHHQRHFQTRLM